MRISPQVARGGPLIRGDKGDVFTCARRKTEAHGRLKIKWLADEGAFIPLFICSAFPVILISTFLSLQHFIAATFFPQQDEANEFTLTDETRLPQKCRLKAKPAEVMRYTTKTTTADNRLIILKIKKIRAKKIPPGISDRILINIW